MSLYYKPVDGWVGDCIPFFWQDEYHLFYLKDYRSGSGHGWGSPWYHVGTRDFITFIDYGEALPQGDQDAQDLGVGTGSVIERCGQFHIFYTGINPHLRAHGKPEQAVMHAISDDLRSWRKIPEDTFFAPPAIYESHDWRDPFVFRNDEAGRYVMLLAARVTVGPPRRRGCIALCTSHDLCHWEIQAPFWAPGLYLTHECPDLFSMDGWWYLVFSEFSESFVTRYRKSRSLDGPWLTPSCDTFDGRALYAAKTATDGRHRYLFGWNPTRDQERDDRAWNWGGNLIVHEVLPTASGDLAVRAPDSINQAFQMDVPIAFKAGMGDCATGATTVMISAPGSFGYASSGALPDLCRITATITFSENTHGCGVMLRVSEDVESAYYIRLEPQRNRLVFDSWPRPGDIPYMVGLERPLTLLPDHPVELTVIVDGTICEVYVGGIIAMSARLYNLSRGDWGVFVSEGTASFDHVALSVRSRASADADVLARQPLDRPGIGMAGDENT